ncbi:MAG: vdh1 [Acidimicrobiia bacterium]|nr:vdh1 [Acidimicrobiia bacterium]
MAADRTAGWQYFRDAGDVFESEGTWYFTSTEAVQFAHRHPEIFSSARAFDTLGSPVPLIPIAIDPPQHKQFRKVLDPMLAPKVINQMEDELRAQVRELILAFAGKGECDVVAELGRLYPTQVFLTLFGLPLEHRDQFIEWVEVIVEQSIEEDEAAQARVMENAVALFGFLQENVDAKRANPGDDMLSRILSFTGDEAWSDAEVLGLCFLFTLAGLDTVTAAIGFTLMHLAENPELRRRIVANPALIPRTIEEALRLELPAPMTPRITLQDVEVAGHHIPAGSRVSLCIAVANRDEALFERPNELDVDAEDRGHMAFGGGIHRCLGSHLARRELRLVVEEFHKLIPEYEMVPGAQPRVTWPAGTLHLNTLPLRFPPAAV